MRDVLVMVCLHNSRTELGHHLNHVIPQLHLIVLCAPVSPGLPLHTVQLQTLALRNRLSRQEIKHVHQEKGGGSGQREDAGEVGREAMPAPHCHLISPVLQYPQWHPPNSLPRSCPKE